MRYLRAICNLVYKLRQPATPQKFYDVVLNMGGVAITPAPIQSDNCWMVIPLEYQTMAMTPKFRRAFDTLRPRKKMPFGCITPCRVEETGNENQQQS